MSESDELSDWIGATEDEIRLAFPEKEFIVFEREKVDSWLSESRDLSHFYEQSKFLRLKAKPQMLKLKNLTAGETGVYGHFLL